MKIDFKYLQYSKEDNTFHIKSTHLFNKKEVDKIKTVLITEELESGDVIYRNHVFNNNIGISKAVFNKYCKNILIKDKKLVSGTNSPEKATLFPIENTSNLIDFVVLIKQDNLEEKEFVFNKISCDKEYWSNNATINIDNVDYPVFALQQFLETDGDFIYTLDHVPDNCDTVSGLLRGITVDYFDSYESIVLSDILKSEYVPRLMKQSILKSNLQSLKSKMDYSSYSFLLSIKKNEPSLFTVLLSEYSSSSIRDNSDSDPESFIYLSLLGTIPSPYDKLFAGEWKLTDNSRFINTLSNLLNKNKESVLEEVSNYINNNLLAEKDGNILGTLSDKMTVRKHVSFNIKSRYEIDYYSIPENITSEPDYPF